MTEELIEELRTHQDLLLENVRQSGKDDYSRQFHPDLSPLGWHLGHCVFTELYWLRERLLDDTDQANDLKALYVPELMPKRQRAAELPGFEELLHWARRTQAENRTLLGELLASNSRDPLLRGDYLAHFLIQHYAQHYEITMYILAQRQQHRHDDNTVEEVLCDEPPAVETLTVPAGSYEIGTADEIFAYDNERPVFQVHLKTFRIASRPVSNAGYLCFMKDGGYDRKELWTERGWSWRREHDICSPEHWRHRERGKLCMIDHLGCRPPEAAEPVFGLSHHEASAFACWAGARLPHEYEWEAAKKSGVLDNDGRVWEWCANTFHPYRGFQPFPYEGYSVPWFDGRHFTLRGGSDYTRDHIRRPGFRNYYEADKRHIRAGLRLVYEQGLLHERL